jgi:hypothetical protein
MALDMCTQSFARVYACARMVGIHASPAVSLLACRIRGPHCRTVYRNAFSRVFADSALALARREVNQLNATQMSLKWRALRNAKARCFH